MDDFDAVEAQRVEESRPKTDVRAGTRWFAITQILRMLVAFAVATLVARQLGAEGKGVLALVQQAPSILALVMGLGFGGVNVYYVGSGRRTSAEALTDSLLISAFALVAGVPLSFVLMRMLPALEPVSSGVILLSALSVPLGVLASQVAGILVGEGRPAAQARAQSLALVINIAVVAVLYFNVRLTVAAVVAASVAASLIAVSIMMLSLGVRRFVPGSLDRMRDAAGYARRRYFTEIAAMLELRVDIVMLGLLATSAATGVYSVAVALVELLWFVPRAAETPLLSRFLGEDSGGAAALVALAVRLTVLLEAVMLAAAALLLAPAVRFVFGPQFTQAPALFWLLVPGVVANALAGPVLSYLTSRGHQFPKLSAATVLGNVLLNALLIPVIGVAGAAIASSVTYALGSAWLVGKFLRESGMPLGALLLPRRTDLATLTRARAR